MEGFRAWIDCLRSCHSISIGFKPGLWLGHSKTFILFFLSHSEVDLLVCLGSLSCCITQVCLSLRSQTDGRTFSFRIFWYHGSINYGKSSRSWSCKAAPDHHTTTTMFDCWYDVLFMKSCVGFKADVTGHAPSKKFNFCLISPQNICPKVLGIIKIFLASVRQAFVFFLVNSGFYLGTLPWMPFLPSLFLIVESWTLTLIEASEACSSLDVVLGSFMTSWMSRRCALGVILVGRPLLGRFTTVPSFLHL